MGKRKIEIKKIDDRKKRSITFTKRRQGLFKMAKKLGLLTGADISLIVFSPAGKPYTYGNPDSNEVLGRFPVKEEEGKDDGKSTRTENGDGFGWDGINMDELDTIEKLYAVRNQLLQVKNLVIKRKEELLALPSSKATTSDNMEDSCMFSMKEDEDSWLPCITFDDMEESDELFKDFDVDQKMQQLEALIYN